MGAEARCYQAGRRHDPSDLHYLQHGTQMAMQEGLHVLTVVKWGTHHKRSHSRTAYRALIRGAPRAQTVASPAPQSTGQATSNTFGEDLQRCAGGGYAPFPAGGACKRLQCPHYEWLVHGARACWRFTDADAPNPADGMQRTAAKTPISPERWACFLTEIWDRDIKQPTPLPTWPQTLEQHSMGLAWARCSRWRAQPPLVVVHPQCQPKAPGVVRGALHL
jgi:hypothetical protein